MFGEPCLVFGACKMFCRTLSIFVCVLMVTRAEIDGTQDNNSDYDYFPLNYRQQIRTTERPIDIDLNEWESMVSNHNFNSESECGGTFRDRQVILKSPHYPRPYASNSHCIYTFYSPFVCASEFHIQFLDFSLQTSPNCIKDRLTIGHEEILCGKVIGIMKYRAKDGMLRIVFSSDESIEDRGFKLLITRLPCTVDDTTDSPVATTSTEENVEIFRPIEVQPTTTEQTFTSVTANWNGVIPSHEFELPNMYRHPFFISEFEQPTLSSPPYTSNWPSSIPNYVPNNVLPIIPSPFVPSIAPANFPQSPVAPQPQPFAGISQCCANSFHQNKFYLVSDGFPYSGAYRTDCIYHIQRYNLNICRLRIEFKYLLLGAPLQNPFDCTQNFLEIDGRRICGCKTGMVYVSQWGPGPGDRIIRYVNAAGYRGNQGFVLDVTQEECPFRLSAKRQSHSPVISAPNSQFLFAASDANRCFLDYGQWIRLAADQLFQSKPVCIKTNF